MALAWPEVRVSKAHALSGYRRAVPQRGRQSLVRPVSARADAPAPEHPWDIQALRGPSRRLRLRQHRL